LIPESQTTNQKKWIIEMIRVLVVDDSLFMRRLVSDMLNSDKEVKVVDTARNGAEAVSKIPKLKPDVVTLDLVMPGWDGLTTLKRIMNEFPTPVVILSAYSKKDADTTLECLNEGAVGFVLKPSGELSLDIEKIKNQLLEEVRTASKVNFRKISSLITKKTKIVKRKLISIKEIIVIGASTGGPQTLEVVLSFLSADFPVPIIVIQHMPSIFFTQSLAERFNKICALKVKVAENNEMIQAGKVYLAPSGFQLTLKTRRPSSGVRRSVIGDRNSVFGSQCSILDSRVTNDESLVTSPETFCLKKDKSNEFGPSIDVTMKSAAQIFNKNTIGIILSGMGRDGLEGIKTIKEAGGRAIVQDASSLIFGMPKTVIDAGFADQVLPASEIPSMMLKYIS